MSAHHFDHVIRESQHTGSAYIVLLMLADCANEHGEAWPSIATLTRKSRLGKRATIYNLHSLLGEDGSAEGPAELIVERRPGHGNVYRLALPGMATCQKCADLRSKATTGARIAPVVSQPVHEKTPDAGAVPCTQSPKDPRDLKPHAHARRKDGPARDRPQTAEPIPRPILHPPLTDLLEAEQQRPVDDADRALLDQIPADLRPNLEAVAWHRCLQRAGGKRYLVLKPDLDFEVLRLWQQENAPLYNRGSRVKPEMAQ